MTQSREISLYAAILININIIIGAGLFINPRPLALLAGKFGFLSYIAGGLFILPLAVCLSKLATKHPLSGGLYVYSDEYISPFAGFLSAWGYFLGKCTSSGLLSYTFIVFFQKQIPILARISTLPLAVGVVFLLALMNIAGVSIGGKIQWVFVTLKTIPIGFVILTGLSYFFLPAAPSNITMNLKEMVTSLPIALFALLGFEVTCSIAHLIKNPKKNAQKAIVISSMLVACIAALFQFSMFRVVGDSLAHAQTPLLSYVLAIIPNHPFVAHLLNGFVFTSILGGAFGMLTSNCWNLYTIGKNKHFPGRSLLIKETEAGVPWVSLLIEAFIASLILVISVRQVALQNMAVLGMYVSYFLNSYACYKAFYTTPGKKKLPLMPGAALASSALIIGLCTTRILSAGISYSFLLILIAGIVIERMCWRRPTA